MRIGHATDSRLADNRLVVSPLNSRRALQGLIDGARHTLDLYEEEVDDGAIETHLIAAAHRGVRVRLLTSAISSGVTRLRAGRVSVGVLKTPYIHAKAIVADSRLVFVGSENVSATSLDSNREMGVILGIPSLAAVVSARFAGDWRSARTSSGPSHGGTGHLTVRVTT